MNRTRAVGVSTILLSVCGGSGGSLFGQSSKTGSPADHSAQLSSTNVQSRVEALQALGRLGTAARSESIAVEKCIGDGAWDVQFAAVRALPEILGPEDSAKVLTRIVQD